MQMHRSVNDAGASSRNRTSKNEAVANFSDRGSGKAQLRRQEGRSQSRRWLAPLVAGSAAALGILALYNRKKADEAERQYPPIGRFLNVDGVRLHYIERGQGEPLVLIHGNGT